MFPFRAVVVRVALFGLVSATGWAQGGSGVQVWLTSADRTSLFAQQAAHLPLVKLDPAGAGTVIAVDTTKTFQTMDGFGFALTGGSAELLMRMTPARRAALLQELFATGPGSIGVSYLRLSIGSSDMNEQVFAYDDLPPGQTDPTLAHFSLGPDLKDVIPVLKEILAIDPGITIMATPWSAPSWMKTNGLPKAGQLKPEWYAAYAQYFVLYLRAMAAQGITIRAITMQNEPLNANNTPSMILPAPAEADFLAGALGPALKQAGLHPDVILYDHNCDDPQYPIEILADAKAKPYAQGSGFHLYAGSMDALTKVHDADPGKSLYFTEQMVIQPDANKPLRIAEPVSQLVIAAPRNWSRNVLLWNLAADPNNGPHTGDGGCPVCQGAITLSGDTVTRNLAFYTVAHASALVRPGSVRVGSESSAADVLPNVAYRTPDHRTVLLVANPGPTKQSFRVTGDGRQFAASLDGGSVATFVW